MRNRFGGFCETCGIWIDPMKGETFYKDRKTKKWKIHHKRDKCPNNGLKN